MGGCSENGLLLAALSSLLFSLCSLVAKELSDLHPLQLSCLSFLGVVLTSGVTVLYRRAPLFPAECRKSLLSRSLTGTFFLVCCFYSVQLIPLGDASVLFYMAPTFTVILAKPLLKEPTSSRNLVFAIVLLVSVVLVVKPPFIFGDTQISKEYIVGVLMAITASLTEALGNITLRNLKNVHFSVVMFNYGLMSFLQTSIVSLIFTEWIKFNSYQVILILILVLLNSVEQIFVTLALKFEKAGIVALVQASDIIYGYAFQVIFFKGTIDLMSIFGAVLIAVIICFISLESKKSRKDYSVLIT